MGYAPRPVEDILYTLHQCKHCGDWLNDKGFVDLNRIPKIKTSKGVYCKNCKTKAKRDELDKNNQNLFNGKIK